MKRILGLGLVLMGSTALAFAGSSKIVLTAPTVTSAIIGGHVLSGAELSSLNTALGSEFSTLQDSLNTDYFSKFHDQTDLARGFSNASSSTFDSATLDSFQNYDLFSLMLGVNFGATGIPLDPSQLNSKVDGFTSSGDSYLGLGTGGFAGHLGLNTSFLVKNLYLSAQFGFWPKTVISGNNTITFQQGMFGLGANYKLMDKYDLALGLLTWRGLSLGSGLIYNASSTTVDAKIDKTYLSAAQNVTINGNPTAIQGQVSNIHAKLNIDNSSLVIPLDLSTSFQAFWLINLGFGAGVDVAFSGSKVNVGASSDLNVVTPSSGDTVTTNGGAASVTASDTNGNGDIFLPKVFGSLGFNLSAFKVDVPVTYFPTTQSLVLGINFGAVW